MAEGREVLAEGPVEGVSYPLKVQYCGLCSMPLEYCENGACPEKCRDWLTSNLPDMVGKMSTAAEGWSLSSENRWTLFEVYLVRLYLRKTTRTILEEAGGGEGKKRQKRGGKGGPKAPKVKAEAGEGKITLQRAPRGKKSVTVVKGLGTFDIDLKAAAKMFASKFACGSSVTGADEIVIQGDVKDDLFDLIPEKWKQVSEDSIEDLGDQKR